MCPEIAQSVFLDFETLVEGDYSLAKMSTADYVTDPRFQTLGVGVALGIDPVKFFPGGSSGQRAIDNAKDILVRAASAGMTCVAHNAFFEAMILDRLWGIRFQHYADTMAYARFLGIAPSLANTAAVFGMGKLEAPDFTIRDLTNPTLLKKMARYCATDVALCREIFRRAIQDSLFGDLEWFLIDQTVKINLGGIHVDPERIQQTLAALCQRRNDTIASFSKTYTFSPGDLTSASKVKTFLKDQFGVDVESLDKRNPELAVLNSSNRAVGQFLRDRETILAAGRYNKQLEEWQKREPFTGVLRYYGAHTGRFSSGGRDADGFNLQGLPKSHGSIPEVADIRKAIVPPKGMNFIVVDLSQIEARILASYSDASELTQRFATGEDVYLWFARQAFPDRPIEKGGVNGHLRQVAKAAILGLGFGMGFDSFLEGLKTEEPNFDVAVARQMFNAYHQEFPTIIEFRRWLWQCFAMAFDDDVPTELARLAIRRFEGPIPGELSVQLVTPTGRPLYYLGIRKTTEMAPWGKLVAQYWFSDGFEVKASGRNGRTHTGPTRKFEDGRNRRKFLPQTLIENFVQAGARDLLMAQIRDLEQIDGLKVAFHVHDEVVVLCEECRCPSPTDDLNSHRPDCPWVRTRQTVEARFSSVPESLPAFLNLTVSCEVSFTVRTAYGK